MTPSFLDLPWLPVAPDGFRQRCRQLTGSAPHLGATLQALATFRTTPEQAAVFARVLRRLGQSDGALAPLSPVKLGVVSNATMELLADEWPIAASRHGVALTTILAPFDQVLQQGLDPRSQLNAAGLDLVLIAVDHRWMRLDEPAASADPSRLMEAAMDRLRGLIEGFQQGGRTTCILPTIPVPPLALFGNFDRRVQGSVRSMIEVANRRIVELGAEQRCYVLDIASLADRVGTDRWFDPAQWAAYKLPFSSRCNAAYAELLGRLLGAIRGKSRKCLVLDLDNTIWGGVVGDDGLAGIRIGSGHALGEAFAEVQKFALQLRERGVLLAVSSKNDDAVAREPFRNHPGMLLREQHIAVFQANWTDKASNLEAIARSLNIGTDALVLLDDNPAERAQVRSALPAVAVPELPSDPSWFPWFLAAAGYFEAVSFSDEDRTRALSYAADARRAEVEATTGSLADYLTSLRMVMNAAPFDPGSRPRIVQLINKTNQYNLTTRRYTEAEIAGLEDDPDAYTLQVRLSDRFGDLGMIAVIIATWEQGPVPTLVIQSWLMSCRVLGRRVEEAMLARVVADAKRSGMSRIRGIFRATAKNGMVRDHYVRLGFSAGDVSYDGSATFEFAIDDYVTPSLPFEAPSRSE